MNSREKILVGIIGALTLVIATGFATNFGFTDKITTQTRDITKINEQSDVLKPKIVDDSSPAIQPKLEYAAISDNPNQKSPLTILFKNVENSVVQITSKVSVVNRNIIINGSPLESESSRLGSGFVYDTNGRIITNNHVVDGAQTVDVRFVDGNIYSAKVIGTDPFNDIAVLQITDDFTDESVIPLPLANSDELEVGQQIVAIGNPFGLSDTMTTG
ncbi:MAG: S1C family serine protease, partial [Candidatus Nitrosotenuis sp.]